MVTPRAGASEAILRRQGSGDGVVLAAPDLLARSAALQLARATGRKLITLEGVDWAGVHLRSVLDRLTVRSACLVAPPWRNNSEHEPSRHLGGQELADICFAFRQWCLARGDTRQERPIWGILTGADPAGLKRQIVKSSNAIEVASLSSSAPVAVVRADGPPQRHSINAPVQRETRPGEPVFFRMTEFHRHDPNPLAGSQWDWLIIEGHGRSYCVNEGLLCGARSFDEGPELDLTHCLPGWVCATPYNLRIDPRRYNARVLVIDACEPGNGLSPGVSDSHPPLVVTALQGSPSAIIAPDGITIRSDDDPADIVRAVARCATVGEVAQELNDLRRRHNSPMPYVVFGDPETPTGSALTSSEASDKDASTYFESLTGQARKYRTAPLVNADPSVLLTDPSQLISGEWSAITPGIEVCPELRNSWHSVTVAQEGADHTTDSDSARVSAAMGFLRALAPLAGTGWWPQRLWMTAESVFDGEGETCISCGGKRGIARLYVAGLAARRRWVECPRCRIFQDDPAGVEAPAFEVTAPDRLVSGSVGEATVGIRQPPRSPGLIGALLVGIDGDGAGVETSPHLSAIQIGPGESWEGRSMLQVPHPVPVPQLYFLRAIAILSGQLYWRSRPISIEEESTKAD